MILVNHLLKYLEDRDLFSLFVINCLLYTSSQLFQGHIYVIDITGIVNNASWYQNSEPKCLRNLLSRNKRVLIIKEQQV